MKKLKLRGLTGKSLIGHHQRYTEKNLIQVTEESQLWHLNLTRKAV